MAQKNTKGPYVKKKTLNLSLGDDEIPKNLVTFDVNIEKTDYVI